MDINFGGLLDMAESITGILDNSQSAFGKLRGGKIPAEFVDDFIALATNLGQAKVELATLKMEIVEAQRAYETVEQIKRRKRNYVLSETPVGERVYRLKDDADTGEPPHEVCPACFERYEIRILQPRGSILQCDSCEAVYRVGETTVGVVKRRDRFPGSEIRSFLLPPCMVWSCGKKPPFPVRHALLAAGDLRAVGAEFGDAVVDGAAAGVIGRGGRRASCGVPFARHRARDVLGPGQVRWPTVGEPPFNALMVARVTRL